MARGGLPLVFLARRTQPLGICLSLFGMFRRLFLSLGRSHWSPCPLPLALYSLPSLALASPSTCRLGEGPEHRLKPPEITMLGGGLSGPCYPRRRPRGPTLSVRELVLLRTSEVRARVTRIPPQPSYGPSSRAVASSPMRRVVWCRPDGNRCRVPIHPLPSACLPPRPRGSRRTC